MKRLKQIRQLLADLWLMIVTYLPGSSGVALRRRYWRRRLRSLGAGTIIDTGVYFQHPEFIAIGRNCWIDQGVMILAGLDVSTREKTVVRNAHYPGQPGEVTLGDNIHVGPRCILSGISGGLHVSDECGISADCKVYAFSHHFRSKREPGDDSFNFSPMVPPERQCIIEGAVFLGRNTGVALGAVILPGVALLADSFVAIGSLLAGGVFEANALVAGSPAKVVGRRYKVRADAEGG